MSAGDMHDEQVKEALITYEKLQAIEDDFEDVELEIRKSILVFVSQKLY
jgi:hypothetical protein